MVYSFRHSTSRRLLSHEVCGCAWAPWSRGWTLRHTRVRLPVLHCTFDSPSLYRVGGKGHTNAPFRSYGSGTLLRVLNPCVGPASSTALMTVTRTVLTIPGPYTQLGRRCEVSFIRSQGPHDPVSAMVRYRSGVDINDDEREYLWAWEGKPSRI